jgi:protein TonB
MKNFLIILGFLFANFSFGQISDSSEISKKLSKDDTPVMFTRKMPYYKSCVEFSGEERNKCTSKKIHEAVIVNFKLPKKARENDQQGTTYVRFVVNKKGKIKKVEVLKSSSHKNLDDAAVKAVEKLPTLIPAINDDGNPVSIIYTIPVKIEYK